MEAKQSYGMAVTITAYRKNNHQQDTHSTIVSQRYSYTQLTIWHDHKHEHEHEHEFIQPQQQQYR